MCRKAESIGDCRCTGPPPPGRRFRASVLTPQTLTVQVVKFDRWLFPTYHIPLQIYTSSYDCSIRSFSMGSGLSKEVFSSGDVLINSIDFDPAGRVMWISDAAGGVTRFDTRLGRSKATWHGLSRDKIGSVSVNPTKSHFLLTASNSRQLRSISSTYKFFGVI